MFHYVAVADAGVVDLTESDNESVVVVEEVDDDDELPDDELPDRRTISGVIVGRPVPKAQPKYTSKGGKNGNGRYFSPTQAKQNAIAKKLRANRREDRDDSGPLHGAVYVKVNFYYRADDESQLGKAYMEMVDVDNLQKLILDAMKQADFFGDDSQVFAVDARKRYCLNFDRNFSHTSYEVREVRCFEGY